MVCVCVYVCVSVHARQGLRHVSPMSMVSLCKKKIPTQTPKTKKNTQRPKRTTRPIPLIPSLLVCPPYRWLMLGKILMWWWWSSLCAMASKRQVCLWEWCCCVSLQAGRQAGRRKDHTAHACASWCYQWNWLRYLLLWSTLPEMNL